MSERDPLDLCKDPVERGAALRFADKSGIHFKSFGEALAWGLKAIAAVTFARFFISIVNK